MNDDDAAPDDDLGGEDVWGASGDEEQVVVDLGPPVRATFLIRADKVPVAPWAQGWRVGSIGPENGHVTLVCEHDIDLSPVAQLSAITGILGTLKQAQLDVVWWTMQTRGPLELDKPDMDSELRRLLADDGADGGDQPV